MPHGTHAKNTDSKRKLVADRFIEALRKDISSATHSAEINTQVLFPAISLLENRDRYPQLSLAQMVRGTLNMAFVLQNSEWKSSAPEKKYARYVTLRTQWFGNYDEQFKVKNPNFNDIAVPVIERASEGPLFMMTDCVKETLKLYFEYVKQVESTIEIPRLPLQKLPDGTIAIDTFIPEEPKNSNKLLDGILVELDLRISSLKNAPEKYKNNIKAAEELRASLNAAVAEYYAARANHPLIPREYAVETFAQTSTKAIKRAKSELEWTLDWEDYLLNLLKSIANAFRSTANTWTNSKFTLFTLEKAPGAVEVEQIERGVTNWSNPFLN